MSKIIANVIDYSSLRVHQVYSNGEETRKLIYVGATPAKVAAATVVQWQGKQHKGNGGADTTAKSFRNWVGNKPKHLPTHVWANSVDPVSGLYSVDCPVGCSWNEELKLWVDETMEFSTTTLGYVRDGVRLVFTSGISDAVMAWTIGVRCGVRSVKSFCDSPKKWGSL